MLLLLFFVEGSFVCAILRGLFQLPFHLLIIKMLNGRAINTPNNFGGISMARNGDLVLGKRTSNILFKYTTITLDNGEPHYILSVNSETRCLLDSKYSPNDVVTNALMFICASFFMRLFIIPNAPTVSL